MIDLPEIEAARAGLRGTVRETPCLPSRQLADDLGLDVWLKYENLQLTGSFKVRGAVNKLRSLSPDLLRRGVVAASAGNHAQGVAFAGRETGAPATVVMPLTAPLVKVANTERLGARAVLHGETFEEAYAEACRRAQEEGLAFIHPFEDPRVIAGQGTIGLELVEQVPDLGAVVVPIGGGGLISGIATAVKSLRPEVRVYGVVTEAAPAAAESFRGGTIVERATRRSVADGIAVKRPGELTFAHIRRYVDDVVTVSEEEIRAAIFRLLEGCKTLAEGAAAAAVAALAAGRLPDLTGRRVAVVLSGGNIDVQLLERIIDLTLVQSHRLVRFRTGVPDRPGALADLLQVIAGGGGNVMRITHDRVFKHTGFWEAEIEVTLETRNEEHVQALHRTLREQGYEAEILR
ncbi:MAG TPA: threonine ammonia-lyase [Thermoanaerobaculia bacterium]|nr:threonine ammonia-lyase [Thermoanaerobaculia bacterium]